jgi:hypothetical protein
MSRNKKTLLYSITTAAIDSKILYLIIENDERLSRGADGQLLWEKLNNIFKEKTYDYTALLKLLTTIQAMSKHPTESPRAYLHRFSAAINELKSATSLSTTRQVPPPHMLAYYFIDGLRYPKEDFLPILSDLKRNTGRAQDFYTSSGDLTVTLRKAIEHADACQEIKGVYKHTTPSPLSTKKTPPPEKITPEPKQENPHVQKFIKDLTSAPTKEAKLQVLNRAHTACVNNKCSLHPLGRSHPFKDCYTVKNQISKHDLTAAFDDIRTPRPSPPPAQIRAHQVNTSDYAAFLQWKSAQDSTAHNDDDSYFQ